MKATSDRVRPDQEPGRKVWPLVLLLAIVILAATGVWLLIQSVRNPLNRFEVTEFESVTISAADAASRQAYPVNQQRWSDLLRNFRSSTVEWNQAKWQGLATLEFQPRGEETIAIEVYDTGRETGCFSINRVYYSGGDEKLIQRLLNDARRRHGNEAFPAAPDRR